MNRFLQVVRAAVWAIIPFVILVVLVVIGVSAAIVAGIVVAERDVRIEQASQVEEILREQRRQDANRQDRLAAAVREVDRLGRVRHAELLIRIEALLARPAGVPPDPVTAEPAPGASQSVVRPSSGTPTPARRSTATPAVTEDPTATTTTAAPTTTTTSRDQRSCLRHPEGPRC